MNEVWQGLMDSSQWWVLISCIVLFLMAILLVVLLRKNTMCGKEIRYNIQVLQTSLDKVNAQNVQQRVHDREELNRNLHDFNDSVIKVIGEMSRTQQAQLDSFGGQIRAVSRMDEERMERMRVQIEDKLNQYDKQMAHVSALLDEKLAVNERRLEQMRITLAESIKLSQDENERKLEQIRITVGEKLDATLDKRLGESFQMVSERLEQVYRGLGEMQTLAQGVGDLKKVLTNVKTRGMWGEVQLGALLEQMLAAGQYETNVIVKPGTTERVEYAVRLPGKELANDQAVYLPIDAKFPLEDYRRLLDAQDGADPAHVEEARRALDAAIRTEARRICTKYIEPPYTTDFAIMFLPAEGLYAEVLRCGDTVEKLQSEFRVVVTGPTTFLALLNSLQMGFKTVAIERRSSEVWALLGAVKTEFGRFADLLVRTQHRLRQASDSIDDAARKTRTIQRKLQNVEELSERDANQLIDLSGEMDLAEMEPLLEEAKEER